MKNGTLEATTFNWIKRSGYKIPKTVFYEKITTHPDYPSLFSVTNTLDELSVPNIALHIDKDRVHELPLPFLAHCKRSGDEEFQLIKKHKHFIKSASFKDWDGTVVLSEKDQSNRVQQEHKSNYYREMISTFRLVAIPALIILWFFTTQSSENSGPTLAMCLSNLLGLFTSILLVLHEMGIESKIGARVCKTTSDFSCDSVLKSKFSKIGQGITWSDLAAVYFSVSGFILLLSNFSNNPLAIIRLVALISLIGLPLSVFSLIIQKYFVKKWCPLCLILVASIWINVGVSLYRLPSAEMGFVLCIKLSSLYIIVFLIYWECKLFIERFNDLKEERLELKRFKNSEAIFNSLLTKNRTVNTTPFKYDFQIGNASAETQLLVACNPFCRPCAISHRLIDQFLLECKDNVGVTIRFNITNTNVETDRKTKAVNMMLQQMLGLQSKFDSDIKIRKILNDWFELMDLESFCRLYPSSENIDSLVILEAHRDWTQASEISHTPTIFLNGKELPDEYHTAEALQILSRKIAGMSPTD